MLSYEPFFNHSICLTNVYIELQCNYAPLCSNELNASSDDLMPGDILTKFIKYDNCITFQWWVGFLQIQVYEMSHCHYIQANSMSWTYDYIDLQCKYANLHCRQLLSWNTSLGLIFIIPWHSIHSNDEKFVSKCQIATTFQFYSTTYVKCHNCFILYRSFCCYIAYIRCWYCYHPGKFSFENQLLHGTTMKIYISLPSWVKSILK